MATSAYSPTGPEAEFSPCRAGPAAAPARHDTPPMARTWPPTSKASSHAEYVQLLGLHRAGNAACVCNARSRSCPDERIFIIYHQITELYFKLCLREYEQIGRPGRAHAQRGGAAPGPHQPLLREPD
ncbi:MAG: hypothetical protein WKG07_04725 [Hymenobacter sp.]